MLSETRRCGREPGLQTVRIARTRASGGMSPELAGANLARLVVSAPNSPMLARFEPPVNIELNSPPGRYYLTPELSVRMLVNSTVQISANSPVCEYCARTRRCKILRPVRLVRIAAPNSPVVDVLFLSQALRMLRAE
ncbi:hypothetical protein AVEN_79867-1 [Araneus ventricosus]|uniref:Uncharacterized protein n=1 Tax=Araneus ventricosus TaxID=182803 RepID=A0A4Y2JH64_ARAVE|nr:hypothetical protein AVEN_79867-1 [Araneus ventricosus]